MRYRPASSFDSVDDWNEEWDRRDREADAEAQAADDYCSEPHDED